MGILAREWGSERSIGTHPIGADGEWINRRVDQRSRDGFGGGEGRVGALSFCCCCCCFVVERSNTFLFFINLFIILYAYITTNFPLNIKILHTFTIVNLHLSKSYLILIYFIK